MRAKVLYVLLLDRIGLPVKDGWMDSEKRVYASFTQEDAIFPAIAPPLHIERSLCLDRNAAAVQEKQDIPCFQGGSKSNAAIG